MQIRGADEGLFLVTYSCLVSLAAVFDSFRELILNNPKFFTTKEGYDFGPGSN